jgi:hypothetical protein
MIKKILLEDRKSPWYGITWAQKNGTDMYESIPTFTKDNKDGIPEQYYQIIAIVSEEGDEIKPVHEMWDLVDSEYNTDRLKAKTFTVPNPKNAMLSTEIRTRGDYFRWLNFYQEITGHTPRFLIKNKIGTWLPINPIWEEKREADLQRIGQVMEKHNYPLD